MKIICMVCPPGSPEIPEAKYQQHMASVHGGSQAVAKAIEQNTPKIINRDDPPPPDFMEIAKMMDSKPSQPETPVAKPEPTVVSGKQQQGEQEIKPLQLKYKWDGNCPTCNSPVRTIVLKANGKTIAVAYCLTHEEVEQREVYPLDSDNFVDNVDRLASIFHKKEVHANGSRTKSHIRETKRSKDALSIAGLSEGGTANVRS